MNVERDVSNYVLSYFRLSSRYEERFTKILLFDAGHTGYVEAPGCHSCPKAKHVNHRVHLDA